MHTFPPETRPLGDEGAEGTLRGRRAIEEDWRGQRGWVADMQSLSLSLSRCVCIYIYIYIHIPLSLSLSLLEYNVTNDTYVHTYIISIISMITMIT